MAFKSCCDFFSELPKPKHLKKKKICDFIVYVLFFVVSITVALEITDSSRYYYGNMVKRLLIRKKENHVPFDEISNMEDWWAFLEETFLTSIYGPTDYQKDTVFKNHTETKPKFDTTILKQNFLLGQPRIRQIRVQNDTCWIHDYFKTYFSDCFGYYSENNEDISSKNSSYYYSKSSSKLFNWGQLSFYHDGGFIKNFSSDRDKNTKILQEIKDDRWFDRGTRLIILEFAMYNVQTNLFLTAKFLAEIPSTGGVFTSYSIQTMQILYRFTPFEIFFLTCKALFYLQIMYYTFTEIMKVYRNGWSYFTSLRSWINLIILIAAYICGMYLIYRYFYVTILMQKFHKDRETYLNLDWISFLQWCYENMLAFTIFCIWIKSLEFLSNIKVQFSITLQRFAKDFIGVTILFLIVMLAFGQLGYLLFGAENQHFRTFSDSIFTLIRSLLGNFDCLDIEKSHRIIGPTYFITYMVFVFLILLNMFLAIHNNMYTEVKSESKTTNLCANFKKTFCAFCEYFFCGSSCRKIKPNKYQIRDQKSVTKVKEIIVGANDIVERFFQEIVTEDEPCTSKSSIDLINQRLQNLERLMDQEVLHIKTVIDTLDQRTSTYSKNVKNNL